VIAWEDSNKGAGQVFKGSFGKICVDFWVVYFFEIKPHSL